MDVPLTPNPAVERTCAKSRAGRSLLRWAINHPVNRAVHRKMGTLEQEEKLVAAGRGKWSQAGVPHKGWQCVDIEDLGEPQITCQMCESQTIRYVHHMQHPDYSEVLEVGCICAGHMEGDLIGAKAREASMKSRASKRKRWLTRKWKISRKGNPWLSIR